VEWSARASADREIQKRMVAEKLREHHTTGAHPAEPFDVPASDDGAAREASEPVASETPALSF
jgi:hypothetical protein